MPLPPRVVSPKPPPMRRSFAWPPYTVSLPPWPPTFSTHTERSNDAVLNELVEQMRRPGLGQTAIDPTTGAPPRRDDPRPPAEAKPPPDAGL
jgi:hypothetical protein